MSRTVYVFLAIMVMAAVTYLIRLGHRSGKSRPNSFFTSGA